MGKRGAIPSGPDAGVGAVPAPDPGPPAAPAPAARPSPPDPADRTDPEAALLRVFNEARDELVSTLMYVLGNADDAGDAAQEAFLKCWRARDTVPDVLNLRAWVFRVGLNAAKD